MQIWNPWHGCRKISPGCKNCYVYRRDESIGKDASHVEKTVNFDLPLKRNRNREYKLLPEDGVVYACMTSDFFLEEADSWRQDCWDMIKERKDLEFIIITKRIERFMDCIPADWGMGYDNVTVCCTCENQERADGRMPVFLSLPIKRKQVICEPMLEKIDLSPYLMGQIDFVICGGESGKNARLCDYDWILDMRRQCIGHNVAFHFKQTGAVFKKDGKIYRIERKYQIGQAAKAGIDFVPEGYVPVHRSRPVYTQMEFMLTGQEKREQKGCFQELFDRLAQSEFRSRFHLSEKDREYVLAKGMGVIRSHAEDFVSKRLSAAHPDKDGKQTPMRGHPVFLAQHATATCCRGCIEKWHKIPQGIELDAGQQEYLVDVMMEWIKRQMDGTGKAKNACKL